MANSTVSPPPLSSPTFLSPTRTNLRTALVGSRPMTISSAVLSSLNIIAHSFGAYLLHSLYRSGSRTVQTIFLMNLSICEVFLSLMMLAEDSLDFVDNQALYHTTTSTSADLQKVDEIMYIVIYSSYVLYCWNIFLITADRLAGTVLHLRYPQYCTIGRAKKFVVASWITTVCFSLGCTLIWEFVYTYDFSLLFTSYILPTLEISLLLFIIASYSFIFRKYLKRRREHLTLQDFLANKQKMWRIFRQSKFYVSVLLIASSIVSMIIPQVSIVILKQQIGDYVVLDSVKIFYEVTFLIDATIYIIIHPAVRRLVLKKLRIYHADPKKARIRVVRLDQPMLDTTVNQPNRHNEDSSTVIRGEPTFVTRNTGITECAPTDDAGDRDDAISVSVV